ncbi:MarR family winged helix-turn-helix transcriptional regulator [Sphingomonas nostoxanthinifaciens]|uniref:MarR family winged helix-turn-helix transcriptional regulator n=1 Tax=Sphingomonas nostoxanthinifaciens TaxID=2872652 RepID=UPI001CC1C249|nr:MarR family transcriptional regulator [Sphingomonas nostoxanthinifaciens]UAK25541.1 MarR family transcriptional regulator [Sphingomonas nostoxanthinifaciens]
MSEANGDRSDEARLANDLRRSVSAFVRVIRQDTGTVRSAQSEALDLLHRLGPMNVAGLAEKRGVTHQTMRLVVAGLDTDGLVHQGADPSDRRSRLVKISPAGCAALAQERQVRTSRIEHAIQSQLSPGERDMLRAAISILDRLAEAQFIKVRGGSTDDLSLLQAAPVSGTGGPRHKRR